MNGDDLKRIKEVIEMSIEPWLEHLAGDIKEIKEKIDAVNCTLNRHEAEIKVNKAEIKNIKSQFKNTIAIASAILAGISFLVNFVFSALRLR